MTLRRKMAFQTGGLIFGLLLISSASLWGVNGLHQDFSSALQANDRLRALFQVGSRLATARTLLTATQPQQAMAMAEVHAAREMADLPQNSTDGASHGLFAPNGFSDPPLRALIDAAIEQLRTPIAAPADNAAQATQLAAINRALARVAAVSADIRTNINDAQYAADRKLRATRAALAMLCALVTLSAIALTIQQYRSVVFPLRRLADGVRGIAGGRFADRLSPTGDAEFRSLTGDFNRMAAELDSLYRNLEQQVQAKSQQLIRSERLAGVGFLAAGVAHEINNPLTIITGHAELSLSRLKRLMLSAPADTAPEHRTAESLEIIRQEAFRCKDIIDKLLSLTRGREERAPIDVAAISHQVVDMLRGLHDADYRGLSVTADGPMIAFASEAELKQVLLNLIHNAVAATHPDNRKIEISITSHGQWIELVVKDNGHGMSPATLERIFEPFFSARPAGLQRGTGLGLSITHAIIQSHGGRISASSEGEGLGSTFTLELPTPPEPQ